MDGVIAMANSGRNRYSVKTEEGSYTTFELLEGGVLRVGELVIGDFESLADGTFIVEGERFSVFVQNYHCSASAAAAWVGG